MFQMAGQVCRVTLGGIQPTGGPPPVLRPCAAGWCVPEAPAWPEDKGKLAGGFPRHRFWYPLVACSGVFAPWALYRGCSEVAGKHS